MSTFIREDGTIKVRGRKAMRREGEEEKSPRERGEAREGGVIGRDRGPARAHNEDSLLKKTRLRVTEQGQSNT